PSGKPNPDRSEGGEIPAVTSRLLACADRETIGNTAFRNCRRDQAGEGDKRADREIDAGGQDDEGHADREQAVDRDLAKDVEEVERREEPRFGDGEACHQHNQENEGCEASQETDDVGFDRGLCVWGWVLGYSLHRAFRVRPLSRLVSSST